MNCPDAICRLTTCPPTDDIPSYLGAYSLQSGSQYVNLAISVPSGGGFYIAPPGTIVINLPPNPTVVSYQGCLSGINEAIPTGSTPAQILAIVADVMNQVAQQASICNAPPVFTASIAGTWTNGPAFVPCDGGLLLNLIGSLPREVTFSISGLSLPGGFFSSGISQADADAQADDYLSFFFGVSVECGYWNAQQIVTCCDMTVQTIAADTYFSLVSQADADAQAVAAGQALCPTCYYNVFTSYTCPDSSVQTVAAGTYMSTVSQAAADALALAAAMAKCPAADCAAAIASLSWAIVNVDPTGNNSHSVSGNTLQAFADSGFTPGSVKFSTSITNNNLTDCHYIFNALTPFPNVNNNGGGGNGQILVNGVVACTEATAWTDQAFTVPASSTLAVSIEFLAGAPSGTAAGKVKLNVN